MSNRKEKILDPNELMRRANEEFISKLKISEKEKKKMRAFINCEPGDLHLFCDGVQNVPNGVKKEYRDEDYDEKGNKI